jgi:galactokinase
MTGHEASSSFEQVFGSKPMCVVRAPGRVNLIGDHTDYTGGLVLPMAIDRALWVAARPTPNAYVEVHSDHFGERVRISLGNLTADPAPAWSRYALGVIALLKARGIELCGAELWIGGDLPPGAGLASSAALEVGVAVAMLTTADASLSSNELAALCRKAEHEYADSPCGIMDQLCCTSAVAEAALLIDCQSLTTRLVLLNLGTAELVVIDTGVRHSIAGAEYAARRRDCTLALEAIRRVDPSIGSFRELTIDRLSALERELDEALFKRARHVVTENARVARAAGTLRDGDLNTFGRLMIESHASLRDDFAVSCPELDTIISAASSVAGVYGARMTGGGFGGCAIALARADAVAALHSAIHNSYDNQYATSATLFPVHSADAAQVKPT